MLQCPCRQSRAGPENQSVKEVLMKTVGTMAAVKAKEANQCYAT
jgi:hypothetical protein